MSRRFIVTGSRWLTFEDHGKAVEDGLIRCGEMLGREAVLVHGNCPPRRAFICTTRRRAITKVELGLDQLARLRWEAWRLQTLAYPADWDRYGPAAGPIRNGEMVADGADLAMAWPHPTERSQGTWDCVEQALAAGIPVLSGWTREPICPCAPERAAVKVHDAVACPVGAARAVVRV